MELLLEKRDLRLLKLLELLYGEKKWHSVEKLAKKIHCSEDSIYKDLTYLQETTGEIDFQILNQSGKGIFLKTSSGISLGKIQSSYIKNTFMYQIIIRLLAMEQLDAQGLMDEYYLSRSTFYRKLKNVKAFFEENNLILDTVNFKLQGPEILIRELYYFFSWQTVKDGEWPFPAAPKKILDHRLSMITTEIGFSLTEVERMQLLHRMAVNFTRTQKKAYVEVESQKNIIDPIRSTYCEPIAQSLNQAIPDSYKAGEIWYNILIFCTYIYSHNESTLDYSQIVTWHKEHETESYLFIKHLFELLNHEFEEEKIKLVENNLFVYYSLLTIANYILLFPSITLPKELRKNWKSQLDYYQHENKNFYYQIKKAAGYLSSLESLEGKRVNTNYCVFTIYGIISQVLDIGSLKKPLKVKIICEADPLSESILGRQLVAKSKFPIEIYTTKDKYHENLVYDLTISDLKIKRLNQSNDYIWNFPPTERDWENILSSIKKMSLEKQIELENQSIT